MIWGVWLSIPLADKIHFFDLFFCDNQRYYIISLEGGFTLSIVLDGVGCFSFSNSKLKSFSVAIDSELDKIVIAPRISPSATFDNIL